MRKLALWGAAIVCATSAIAATGSGLQPEHAGTPRLGRAATQAEITAADISILPDGTGLPPGSGTVAQGRAVYAEKCVVCHAENGAGGPADRLTGGMGSIATDKPIKTVASYWPHAPMVFDYVRRAMPVTEPQSLTNEEVYSVVAYILSIDGIVPANACLDARSLAKVRMPNKNGFVSLEDKGFDGNVDRKP